MCLNSGCRSAAQDSRIFVSCQSGINLENVVEIRNLIVLKKGTLIILMICFGKSYVFQLLLFYNNHAINVRAPTGQSAMVYCVH